MEQDKTYKTEESVEISNNQNTGTKTSEHHSHHSSRSHHGHHSHHSSHSHSHHKKHPSSKHKKSLWKRISSWNNKTISNKSVILAMSTVIIIMLLLLVGFKVLLDLDANDSNIPVDGSNSSTNVEPSPEDSQSANSVSTSSVKIPAYWKKEVQEKTEAVKALQAAGGKDCVSFVWASDTHIPDNSTARTDDIGKLMASMMDNCSIPFAVLTGDIGTRSSFDTETELSNSQALIPTHLEPLWGDQRLLVALGNHDGCYGDASAYYAKQLSPEQMWDLYFRPQTLDSRRVFSEDGTYFYIDNEVQKTRFIVLNSHFGGSYAVDKDGRAINNRFKTSCFGQEQLNWLANIALDMPKGYGAVIAVHVPPNVTYTVDKAQLIGIINAYCNKTTYEGSYKNGVDGWSNNSVKVDFRKAKGEIIALFAGHVHQDTIDTKTLECPLITIISAGSQVNAGDIPERTFGTDTETSFDVVTINRKTRTIYCTRIGSGEDRSIQY